MSEHIGMQWKLKKSCLSQGLMGDEMWAPELGKVPALSWRYWGVDQKCWHFRGRPENFILEHAALKECIFFSPLGMNNQAHASNTNLWQRTQRPLPPGIISAWKSHAGTCCLWIPPLSYVFESSDFECYLKLDTVVFFPHSVGHLVMILYPFMRLSRVPCNLYPVLFLAKMYFRKFHNCTSLYGEVWHKKPDVRLTYFSSL